MLVKNDLENIKNNGLTEEQLLKRKNGIGGSDAAAVCGHSKWKTPLDIFLEKTNPNLKKSEFNERMYWGNQLENAILNRYEQQTGNKVDTFKEVNETFFHPDHSFMIANPDGIVTDKKILIEVKTSSSKEDWGEEYSADIPIEYIFQCAHYMCVLNLDVAHIPVLFNGNDFKIYIVERNENIENSLIGIENDFWFNNVKKNVAPDCENINDIRNKFSISKDKEILCNDEILQYSNRLRSIKEQIKSLESEEEKLKFNIMNFMKDNSVLIDYSRNKLATFKSSERYNFDSKHFKNDHADLYHQFLRKINIRTFLIK